MQKEESIAGVTCSTVAYKVHKFQVKSGVAPYIYHRPAHGQGWEGHQPPYLALGDSTMLEPGMVFSVEPGLYDPERSDAVAVAPVVALSTIVITPSPEDDRFSRHE